MKINTLALPLLPGISLDRRQERYHKPQIWSSRGGIRLEAKAGQYDKVKMVPVPRADGNGCENRPSWDAFDRFVLRFYARFNDASRLQHCGNAERLVKIMYFMEDNSMSITEITDGKVVAPTGLVRRHRIPTVDGPFYTPQDLRVGETVEVYGLRYFITGCDGFTRTFYEDTRKPQPENIETPRKKEKKAVDCRTPRTYEKMYIEVMLGGGHQNNNMEKFMQNDRKVCRFFAVMDDLYTQNYERKPFEVFYYLADDTIMIYEKFQPNCGRNCFPVFYRRARMPRSCHMIKFELILSSEFSQPTDAASAARSTVQELVQAPVTCTLVTPQATVNASTPRVVGATYILRVSGLSDEARAELLTSVQSLNLETRLTEVFKAHGLRLNNGRAFAETDMLSLAVTGSNGRASDAGFLQATLKEDDYVGLHDFDVGSRIQMVKNEFYIYDADDFTRDYYKKLGIPLADKVDVSLVQKPTPRAPTPEYPGYGSLQDSMASVYRLVPKPPRKDLTNFYSNVDKVLRFQGRLTKQDDRNFVFNYFLQDGTFSVHAPPTGVRELTGKYLERGHHVNELTAKDLDLFDLTPSTPRPDFGLRHIRLYGQEFEIYDMDEYTRNYLARMDERRAAEPPPCELDSVLRKIRQNMTMQQKRCQEIFRRFDRNCDGVLTEEEFAFALQKFGFEINTDEMHKLMRYFDPEETGQIVYTKFCDAIYDVDFSDIVEKRSLTVNMADTTLYSARAANRRECHTENTEVRRAVRLVGEVLYTRPALVKRLRFELDNIAGSSKMVDVQKLKLGFERCGYAFTSEDIERCLLYVFQDTRVNYVEFLLRFQASFHDFYAMR